MKILKIVDKIIDFNKKNHQGSGLKKLTPNHMFNY